MLCRLLLLCWFDVPYAGEPSPAERVVKVEIVHLLAFLTSLLLAVRVPRWQLRHIRPLVPFLLWVVLRRLFLHGCVSERCVLLMRLFRCPCPRGLALSSDAKHLPGGILLHRRFNGPEVLPGGVLRTNKWAADIGLHRNVPDWFLLPARLH